MSQNKRYEKARLQFKKDQARKKTLRVGKLTFIVGVLPVIADFLEDLDIEGEGTAFHDVYKAIRELDTKIMQPKDKDDTHFQKAVDSQMIMQRRFREFFKELTNESNEL